MDRSTPHNTATDAELLTRVGIALHLQQRKSLRRLHVTVLNGEVAINGRVHTFHDRQLAIAVVTRVAGVRQLRDEIEVDTSSPIIARWNAPVISPNWATEVGEYPSL